MKLFIVAVLAVIVIATSFMSVAGTQLSNQEIQIGLTKLETVELPGWRLHFGLFDFPRLNGLQVSKIKAQRLQAEIEEHEKAIAAKNEEIEQVVRASNEHKSSSYFMLGILGRTTLVKDHKVVYDEKSLLWGAVKWGERKP